MKWRSLEESAEGGETRSLAEVFAEQKKLIANMSRQIFRLSTNAPFRKLENPESLAEPHASARRLRILTRQSKWNAASNRGLVAKRQAGYLLFPWPLVPVLRGPAGSDEFNLSTNSSLASLIDRYFSPNGTPLLPHGRPASVES